MLLVLPREPKSLTRQAHSLERERPLRIYPPLLSVSRGPGVTVRHQSLPVCRWRPSDNRKWGRGMKPPDFKFGLKVHLPHPRPTQSEPTDRTVLPLQNDAGSIPAWVPRRIAQFWPEAAETIGTQSGFKSQSAPFSFLTYWSAPAIPLSMRPHHARHHG